MLITTDKIGVRITGPVVNLALAGIANSAVVFSIPILVGVLIGTKSAVIKKVTLFNNGAGNTQVIIGTGLGAALFVPLLPALDSLNGLMDPYGPNTDLPEVEAYADITAYPVALLAGTSIDIVLEILIRG